MEEEGWELKDACTPIVFTYRKEDAAETDAAGQIDELHPDLNSRSAPILEVQRILIEKAFVN